MSKIEWTDTTWNPVTGCDKISPGCKRCYAERMAGRLQKMGVAKYQDGFEVRLHEGALSMPFRWRKPHRVFVNSMSDLFHPAVPEEFIRRVFDVIRQNPRHNFQVLTKRPERAMRLANGGLTWPANAWQGVSIESDAYVERADFLRGLPCALRFLSCEPLLGPLPSLGLAGIDWVIVGGESGPGARPMRADWARDLRDRCVEQGIPFFFKQWGGSRKASTGRELAGREWNEMPDWEVINASK